MFSKWITALSRFGTAGVVAIALLGPVTRADASTGVQSVLDARVSAIAANDANAFAATVDPEAADGFRQAQQRLFEGLASLPLRDVGMTTTAATSGDLANGLQLTQKHHADKASLPETRLSYRLGEYDNRPMVDTYWYTYVERNGRWYVGASDDAAVIGLDSATNLWDAGALATQATPHFLVVTATDQTERGKTLAQTAELAMTRFQAQWPLPWPGKIPLLVPSSPTEAARVLHTTADVANFAAFTAYTPVRDQGWEVTPPRLYAQDANLSGASQSSQVGTIVHELTHAAASSYTGPATPLWLQEGLAEWERLRRPASTPLVNGETKSLPSPGDFVANDRTTLSAAYDKATAAVAFLATAKGDDAPIKFLQALSDDRLAAGSPSYNVDQALQSTTGWTVSQFEAAWPVAS